MSRAASCILATSLGLYPVCALARTPAAPAQVVSARQLGALAERIARLLVTDPERALVPASPIADQSVPAGLLAIVPGTPQANPTYVSVPLAIDVDGRLERTVFAGFRITSYIRTAVAARDLAADAIVGLDDVTYARLPYNGRPALDIELFIGRKVRGVLARGDVLYPECTTVNEIVHAGMPALLIVHDGPVRLNADVVARSGGGLGDYVTVWNPQTQKALSGIVTGPNTVELTLPGAD